VRIVNHAGDPAAFVMKPTATFCPGFQAEAATGTAGYLGRPEPVSQARATGSQQTNSMIERMRARTGAGQMLL
jgi:hypothetical protein